MTQTYTGRTYFKAKQEDCTQAGGAVAIDVSDSLVMGDQAKRKWQVQVVTTGVVTAGTLAVGVQSPGASGPETLDTEIDLANGPLLVIFEALAEELVFTPTGFDGTDFDIFVAAVA
jgi:hypothetical protein